MRVDVPDSDAGPRKAGLRPLRMDVALTGVVLLVSASFAFGAISYWVGRGTDVSLPAALAVGLALLLLAGICLVFVCYRAWRRRSAASPFEKDSRFVLLGVGVVSLLVALALGRSVTVAFLAGFRDRIAAATNVAAIRKWARTSSPPADGWIAAADWPACIEDLDPSVVFVARDPPMVVLGWGGTFWRRGIAIGPASLTSAPPFLADRPKLKFGPGAYLFDAPEGGLPVPSPAPADGQRDLRQVEGRSPDG